MTIVDFFFGCRHKHHSFPITIGGKTRRGGVASITGTHVVCFNCGKKSSLRLERNEIGVLGVRVGRSRADLASSTPQATPSSVVDYFIIGWLSK